MRQACTVLACALLLGSGPVTPANADEVRFRRARAPELAPVAQRSSIDETVGVAIGDTDNDGWPDLAVASSDNANCYPRGTAALLSSAEGDDWRVTWRRKMHGAVAGAGTMLGDYDNDGDLDMYVSVGGRTPSYSMADSLGDYLLRNDAGDFTDVAAAAGLTRKTATNNSIWLDFDRDGWLDLYVGAQGFGDLGNRLYRSWGDGTFTDITAAVGLDLHIGAGSGNGMAAADFTGDGLSDLYVGVSGTEKRLFMQRPDGSYSDESRGYMAYPGEAGGIAVGDIDNNGLLDIQTAGVRGGIWGNLLLLNIGGGQFSNVGATAGVELTGASAGPAFGDFDNDGDLDLFIAWPTGLHLNDGTGSFTDVTEVSGLPDSLCCVASIGDLNDDGALDIVTYRQDLCVLLNDGNDNHWLRVEPVGTESTRSGIGAQLRAVAGDLSQVRQILGGLGYYQDEMVAHFGLGPRTRVDSLVVEWPSGRVDVLSDVPVDQKIRVFEGRPGYHVVEPSHLEVAGLADSVIAGAHLDIELRARPVLFAPEARVTGIRAALADWGAADMSLTDLGNGTYGLTTTVSAPPKPGVARLCAMVDQTTFLGPHWVALSRTTFVVPATDLVIQRGGRLAAGWTATPGRRIELDLTGTIEVDGRRAAAASIHVLGGFRLKPDEPVSTIGYAALAFAFHSGSVDVGQVTVSIIAVNKPPYSFELIGEEGSASVLGTGQPGWQRVSVELPAEIRGADIEQIGISVNGTGTCYLDGIRLVTAAHGLEPTAVIESRSEVTPTSFALAQSFPNPFNAETTIRFDLPRSAQIELAVYSLAAQKVSTLAHGHREAGSYQVRWDGRDGAGHELASGVYVYRLTAGERVEARKLLLLR